ncbi:MAG: hypothetical protein K0U47_01860 [Epsilonproteobacteria bacterium]|nr:hypothetical protein [Campylobacterota bacterium]
MRVTNQFLFDNFKNDHNRVLKEINRLTSQVGNGQRIQNSYEDSAVYTDILRLESESSELEQIKERSVQGRSFADASDSALSEFNQTLRDFQTKLIAASNDTLNQDNLESIANELDELKKHMISISNSQINGQYLFAGSAVGTKPVDADGNYHGNGDAMMTLVGQGVSVQHNVDGESLFLGEDLSTQKRVETNVRLTNQISDDALNENSTIQEMVGDNSVNPANPNTFFFISGVQRDGTAFKDVVEMQPNAQIKDLLNNISTNFGDDVKVELTDNGNIAVTDLKSGYSQLSLQMVGVQGIADPLERNLNSVTGDKIIPLTKSGFDKVNSAIDESLQMDQFYFEKNGGILEGNVPLISAGEFADNTTKLYDVMGIDPASAPMPTKQFNMELTDIHGNAQTLSLDLSNNSSFTIGATTYNVMSADGSVTSEADFTVGQLNNIIAMALSDKLPSPNYNDAVKDAKALVDVSINDNGNLKIVDKSNNLSNIEFALYDSAANDFSTTSTPTLSFMSNNAVTTQKADINFFDEIDNIIEAVRTGAKTLDADVGEARSIGIDNAIASLEQMNTHFNNAQAKVGSRSKSLELAEQRAAALEVNVMQVKAQTTEVDTAETILKLNQISLSYQGMLQSISKVNSLTLLNYM